MYDVALKFCDGHVEIRESIESYSLDMDSLAIWYEDLECEFFDRGSFWSVPEYSLESFKVIREY